MLDTDSAEPALRLVDVPFRLVGLMIAAVTNAVRTIPGQDLVAIDLVYYNFDPEVGEPTPVDIVGCSRRRREEILTQQPPPDGLVYIWSNLEFDTYVSADNSDRHLAAAWQDVYDFGQAFNEQIEADEDELDYTWVPRSVLIAVSRRLNEGAWTGERPAQLAEDAVVYPAARSGVDPDTADNLRAALTDEQRQRLDDAGLLLP